MFCLRNKTSWTIYIIEQMIALAMLIQFSIETFVKGQEGLNIL